MVLNGGIQRLVDALIERLNGRIEYVHSRVQRVSESSPRQWTLSLADGGEVRVNACVATIAGGGLSSIVDGVDEALSRRISGVRYASLTVVHLAVPRDERLMRDAFGVLFPGGMRDDLLGVMFNSLIFPHVAPPDKHILTVMLGGAQARGKSVDQAGLQERLPTLVSDLLGISVPEWISLTEWKEAIPQLQVGHHALVASLDECEIAHPGLVFAGVDRGGIGVSDRVRIAREAVQRVYKSVA
jgi:oxygen-dependent protoporphyrinogen oxidase